MPRTWTRKYAIFIYSDGHKEYREYPERPTGLTRRINGKFESPIDVSINGDKEPENTTHYRQWCVLCHQRVSGSGTKQDQ